MKIKNKKILTLFGVGLVSVLTTAPALLDANASLTPPTTYNINYSWDSVSLRQELGTSFIGGPAPVYTRTADGSYFNYTTTINNITHSTILPQGLEITITFNRSNTSWTSVSDGYVPTENRIGSDSSVGTVNKKVNIIISNQTNKDYNFIPDFSSTANSSPFRIGYTPGEFLLYYYTPNLSLSNILISSFTTIEFFYDTTASARYFDAWYLQDLGVSDSYQQGVDDGYIQGQDDADLLVSGFSAMVGILVNFVLMIVNLEVFGVSLIGIFSIIVLFTGIVWTLKLIRG